MSTRFARGIPTVAAVMAAGMAVTIFVALSLRDRHREQANEWIEARADLVDGAIRQTLDDTVSDLGAFAGFLEARPETTQAEIDAFGERIQVSPGVIATAFVRAVPAEELDAFVAKMREDMPSFQVSELDPNAEMIAAGERDIFYPVQFLIPGPFLRSYAELQPDFGIENAFGFDAASAGDWAGGMETVLERGGLVVSDFFSLGELDIGKAFMILDPVTQDGEVVGVVGAAALDVLLTPDLGALSSEISWAIESAGSPLPESGLFWSQEIDVVGTVWQLTVEPTESSLDSLAGFPMWAILALGFMVTLVLSALVRELIERTRDHRRIATLQQAAQDKDRFLATISHEIRTPLTVVAGFSHELHDRGEDLDSDERASLLGEVAQHADEMTSIIEDLLVAARTDIRNVKIHHALIDMRDQVLAAISSVAGSQVTVNEDTAIAFADPGRVRQIIRNLMTNAKRYGGANVAVSITADRNTVSTVITDDGDPIPQDRRDAIFDPYTSVDKDKADVGSIGLGLFISRELARLMNGDLEYDHDGINSRFTLTLPAGLNDTRTVTTPPQVVTTPPKLTVDRSA